MYIFNNTVMPVGVDGQELVSHGTAAFPLVCYDCEYTDIALPWHWRDELEVSVVLEGAMTFNLGGEKYILRPGEGLFVNSGVLHAGQNAGDGPCRVHSFVFHPRLVGGDPGSVFWQDYLSPLLAARSMEGWRYGLMCPARGRRWRASGEPIPPSGRSRRGIPSWCGSGCPG
ncbi:MAG: AraC family ligand binding domain-containing protein [Clostridiales bacterium]|nr:AraC family ligand binding domain-containing protein [Clostridiales bacterium]